MVSLDSVHLQLQLKKRLVFAASGTWCLQQERARRLPGVHQDLFNETQQMPTLFQAGAAYRH
jgi:hypothetical protein